MLCKKLLSNNLSNGVIQTATRMAELQQEITYLNAHVAQTTSMAKNAKQYCLLTTYVVM